MYICVKFQNIIFCLNILLYYIIMYIMTDIHSNLSFPCRVILQIFVRHSRVDVNCLEILLSVFRVNALRRVCYLTNH